jgi:hypothetical protein
LVGVFDQKIADRETAAFGLPPRRCLAGRPQSFSSVLEIASELLRTCREANVILEVEVGVVGGEEDGLDARGVADERLYSTPADAVAVVERLGAGEPAGTSSPPLSETSTVSTRQ